MSPPTSFMNEREIEQAVTDLVARSRTRYNLTERCRAQAACEALGLRMVRGRLPRGTAGTLTTDGRIVVSDAIEWMSRVEFTVFHEIMHHLLEEDGELIEHFTEKIRGSPKDYDGAIERCCDVGAAEFMIPRARAKSLIAEHGFSVESIEPLAGLNGASIVAAAIQLAICAPVDCYVVVCRHGVSPTWPFNVGLYVEQAMRRAESRFPIARGTTIPVDHLFARVWGAKQPLSGPSVVPFRSGRSYPCEYGEAKVLGGQVVGILFMDAPPRKGQLTLMLG